MFKFDNILVPTDFSEQFRISLDYAKELAKSAGSTLHILHVIEDSLVPRGMVFSPHAKIIDVEKQIKDEAETNMNALKEELEKEEHSIKIKIVKGDPAEEIIKYADENGIDAICIYTHGRSGIDHLLFGSTTEKVLRRSDKPVIAVRMPGKDK